jgi:hypothetical protein
MHLANGLNVVFQKSSVTQVVTVVVRYLVSNAARYVPLYEYIKRSVPLRSVTDTVAYKPLNSLEHRHQVPQRCTLCLAVTCTALKHVSLM